MCKILMVYSHHDFLICVHINSSFLGCDSLLLALILRHVLRHKNLVAIFSYLSLQLSTSAFNNYRIAGKFGGGKVWRIWRIVRNSPN